jgi:hypothetical protein
VQAAIIARENDIRERAANVDGDPDPRTAIAFAHCAPAKSRF